MNIDKTIFEKLANIEENLRETSSIYANSRRIVSIDTHLQLPVSKDKITADKNNLKIHFDMIDTLKVPFYCGLTLLMTGPTGVAKTHLSNMFGVGLVGEGNYVDKTCVGLSSDAFLDFDPSNLDPTAKAGLYYNLSQIATELGIDKSYFIRKLNEEISKLEKSCTISSAVKPKKILRVPFAILNEPNQAHETLQAILIAFLDKKFNFEAFEGDSAVGVAYDSKTGDIFDAKKHNIKDKRYFQSVFLSINEGGEYSRNKIDKAVRDRAHFEIPMGLFEMTKEDCERMINSGKSVELDVFNGKGFLEDILKLNVAIRSIPIDRAASEYIEYLQGLDNCVRANSKKKKNIDGFDPASYCKSCQFVKLDDFMGKKASGICSNISNPSPRTQKALAQVAKGFALIRAQKVLDCLDFGLMPVETIEAYCGSKDSTAFADKYISQLEVELEDVKAAAPFVLYSKIPYREEWKASCEFLDNRWDAINHIIEVSYLRFIQSYDAVLKIIAKNRTPSVIQKKVLEYAEKNDPWLRCSIDNDVVARVEGKGFLKKYFKK